MEDNFQQIIGAYNDSRTNMADFFRIKDIELNNFLELNHFLDLTSKYWTEFEGEGDIAWSDSIKKLENEDYESYATITEGPHVGKIGKYLLYLVERSYQNYYIILDRTKKIAV